MTETPRCSRKPSVSGTGMEQMKPKELEMMAAAYEEEKQMMEATHTLDTPTGAELMMNLGIVRRMRGDLEGAAAAYREARRIDSAANAVASTPRPGAEARP